MNQRPWSFGGPPPTRRWPKPVPNSAGRMPPSDEDEAENELVHLVAIAMVLITAASAAVTHILV